MRKSALEPSERDLRNEARALQQGGDPASARRFIAVANAMSRPEKIRQDVMESHANPFLVKFLVTVLRDLTKKQKTCLMRDEAILICKKLNKILTICTTLNAVKH